MTCGIVGGADGIRAYVTYLADGTKCSTVNYVGTAAEVTNLTFLGSLTYISEFGGELKLYDVGFSGGRIVTREEGGTDGGFDVVFNVTDHLGSVRARARRVTGLDANGNETHAIDVRHNEFYPFGKMHADPERAKFDPVYEPSHANLYKFNGKPTDGLQLYNQTLDFGARRYDPEIGRWYGVDPMAEEFRPMSSYVYTFNDPVRFIDPNGMIVTDSLDDVLKGFEAEMAEREQAMKSIIANYTAWMDYAGFENLAIGGIGIGGGGFGILAFFVRSMSMALEMMAKAQRDEFRQIRREIDALKSSRQLYHYQWDRGMLGPNGEPMGMMTFDFNTGVAVIAINPDGGFALFAHELHHAYQFETSTYSVSRSSITFAHDKTDEVAAYDRGAFFGGPQYTIDNLPEIYTEMHLDSIPWDVNMFRNPANDWQGVADGQGVAFRIDGETYYYKPKPNK